jgi:ferredoxin
MCVRVAPALFDQDAGDGTVEILVESPGPLEIDAARRAVAECPSGALTLIDE